MRDNRISAARIAALLSIGLAVGVTAPSTARAQQPAPASFPVNPDLSAESRQFDFWIGEWDVNLRVRQEDISWEDSHDAVARIYPILGGKAVLELWDEQRIKGFSIRYFDTDRKRWVLWLNWPGMNRSGSSMLVGEFRHGRGEFYSAKARPDGVQSVSRYTFSDITPNSLRWDDAYSADGGKTWSNSWIMEFTRSGGIPTLPPVGEAMPTFDGGDRCPDEEFRRYEFLEGARQGGAEIHDDDWKPLGAVTMTGYRVLDGCALIVFLRWGQGAGAEELFAQITWNSYSGRYELLTLDSDPDTPARVYFSEEDAEELLFLELVDGAPGPRRVHIVTGTDGFIGWIDEIRRDDGWWESWRARFGGE